MPGYGLMQMDLQKEKLLGGRTLNLSVIDRLKPCWKNLSN